MSALGVSSYTVGGICMLTQADLCLQEASARVRDSH